MALLPQALALTIPMSLLLALLVAFGRLSADREFVAMQACGISLRRLLRPVGLVSLLCWARPPTSCSSRCPTPTSAFARSRSTSSPRGPKARSSRACSSSFPDIDPLRPRDPADRRLERRVHGRQPRPARADDLPGQTRPRRDRPQQEDGRDGARGRHAAYGRSGRQVRGLTASTRAAQSEPGGDVSRAADHRKAIARCRSRNCARGPTRFARKVSSRTTSYSRSTRSFRFPAACLVFGLIGLALGATNRRDGKLRASSSASRRLRLLHPAVARSVADQGAHACAVARRVAAQHRARGSRASSSSWRGRVADRPMRLPLPAFLRRLGTVTATGRSRFFVPLGTLDRYVALTYLRMWGSRRSHCAAVLHLDFHRADREGLQGRRHVDDAVDVHALSDAAVHLLHHSAVSAARARSSPWRC